MLLRVSSTHVRSIAVRTLSAQASTASTGSQYPDGWQTAKKYTEIPGPGRFGLVRGMLPGGELHNMPMTAMQDLFLHKYGPVVRLPGMLGKPDMVFAYDPVYYERIMRTEGVWPRRIGMLSFEYYRTQVRPDVFKGMGGLVTDQGETWHRLRTVANPVMMPPKVAKSYVGAVDGVSRDFLQKVHVLRDANDELPATFGEELKLWSLESIGTIALDRRLGVLAFERDEDAQVLIKAVTDFFRVSYDVEMLPPIWRYWQTKKFKELMQVLDNMTRCITKYIDEARAALEKQASEGALGSDDETHEISVMQKMLMINRDYAVLMAFDMLMAGIDTTSSVAANMLYLLALNPVQQEKLRAEVVDILPDRNAPLQRNDIDRMSYMRACIKETMRMHPIVLGNVRQSTQDMVINQYQIPKDTHIYMVSSNLMMDEKYFRNAGTFKPERWLRAEKTDEQINPFTYLPFGFGARACIGRRFAEMELQVLIARILRDYRVEWHHGPMQYQSAMITSPSSDLNFKLIPV